MFAQTACRFAFTAIFPNAKKEVSCLFAADHTVCKLTARQSCLSERLCKEMGFKRAYPYPLVRAAYLSLWTSGITPKTPLRFEQKTRFDDPKCEQLIGTLQLAIPLKTLLRRRYLHRPKESGFSFCYSFIYFSLA